MRLIDAQYCPCGSHTPARKNKIHTKTIKIDTYKDVFHTGFSFAFPNKSDKWNSKWANEMLCEKNNNNNNGEQSKILDLCNIILSLLFCTLEDPFFFHSLGSETEWRKKQIPVRHYVFTVELNTMETNQNILLYFFSVKMVNVNLNMRKKHETPKKKKRK